MKKSIFTLLVFSTITCSVHAQNHSAGTTSANTTLSNLKTPTAVNADLLPDSNKVRNLGSVARSWKNIYANGALFLRGSKVLSVPDTANTFIGIDAGKSNVNGSYNTAAGSKTLFSNTSGKSNTALGFESLYLNTTGSDNIAIGNNSLSSNKTGYSNIAIGSGALKHSSEINNMVAIGDSALFNQQSTYSSNVAIGSKAMYTNTTGISNTALGYQSLFTNSTGNNNTAEGYLSLYYNTTGYWNTANGAYSLLANSTGIANSAFGFDAMSQNTTGSYNLAIGAISLTGNYTGTGNIALGYGSLSQGNSDANTAVGYASLGTVTSGFGNTAVGHGADVSTGTLSNSIAIGYNAYVNVSNKAVIGNNSVTVIGGNVGWSILSDGRFKTNVKENVPGLEFIDKLRPVTYNIDETKFAKFIGVKDSLINADKDNYTKVSQKIRTGLIAQEVEKTAQQINYDFDGVNHPQNEKDNYSLVYADFVPSLVKAVQELSKQNKQQQKEIDSLLMLFKTKTTIQSTMNTSAAAVQNQTITIGDAAKLEQNTPNPFKTNTAIHYYLPVNNDNVYINIYNTNGALIKSVKLNGTGNGTIAVNAQTVSGAYTYNLVVDGKIISSKQMIESR